MYFEKVLYPIIADSKKLMTSANFKTFNCNRTQLHFQRPMQNVCAKVLQVYKNCVKKFFNEIVARWFLYQTFFFTWLNQETWFCQNSGYSLIKKH
jgi:hypothetical protein